MLAFPPFSVAFVSTNRTRSHKPSKDAILITIEFSEDAVQMMDSIRDKLGKRSRSDVPRSSLLLMNYLLAEIAKGKKIAIITEGQGESKESIKRLALFMQAGATRQLGPLN